MSTSPISACTDFRLTATDGSVLVTRSMEFAVEMKTQLLSSPRGRDFHFKTANGQHFLTWKAKYGYLFLNSLHVDAAVDGMNEAGLSFEYLFFPDETDYQAIPAGNTKPLLPYIHLGDWILSLFATVDEVKAAIQTILIIKHDIPGLDKQFFPMHASIFDASGKGIVIEYIHGELRVHDNTVGIMTNCPSFDWHVTNLRNYLNLSPIIPAPINIDNMTFGVTGQGSGAIGLPGDASPPSRFVKTYFLTITALPVENADELLILAQHIINNVDIPRGLSRDRQDNTLIYDCTQWVVFKDLTRRRLYYRTYNNMGLRLITMQQINLAENAPRLCMPLTITPMVEDETEVFLTSMPAAE